MGIYDHLNFFLGLQEKSYKKESDQRAVGSRGAYTAKPDEHSHTHVHRFFGKASAYHKLVLRTGYVDRALSPPIHNFFPSLIGLYHNPPFSRQAVPTAYK